MNGTKFKPAVERDTLGTPVHRWVPAIEVAGVMVIFVSALFWGMTTGGWKGWAYCIIGVVVLIYYVKRTIGELNAAMLKQKRREYDLLQRVTRFICDANSGCVDRGVLERIGKAADSATDVSQFEENLSLDDFSLISQSRSFWKDGFDKQNRTTCVNCGNARELHKKNGDCPSR